MNRRDFIGKSAKAAAAAAVPWILPSGRLFAATDNPRVKHVVFCLFAGGIRRWESIDMKDGNLMPNTLIGDSAVSADIRPAIEDMPLVLDQPIQKSGTLFKGFRYKSTFTHHFPAHETAVSGKYYYTNEMFQPIKYPSVFEFFRKHSTFGQDALRTWWIADRPGDFPYMQYSKDPDYGWNYAANMMQPSTLFKFNFSGDWPERRMTHVHELREIIDRHRPPHDVDETLRIPLNSRAGEERIVEFLNSTRREHFSTQIHLWDGLSQKRINQDLINMFAACEVLKTFKPHLLVVNMQDSDIGHFNFSSYCNNMHKADYALAQLWKTIQDDPELRDQTVLIAQPEFGRNATGNNVMDEYGRIAVDHSGDDMSQQAFCLIAGPSGIVHQNKVVEDTGEVIDTVPTIAHLLGFRKMIPYQYLEGKILSDALV